MARIIDLEFKDKAYMIEYNRESVIKVMSNRKDDDDTFDIAITLIECGLLKHHKNDMPDREDIVSWLLNMGDDLQKFVEALEDSVKEVLEVIQSDQKSKNLKWGVRK